MSGNRVLAELWLLELLNANTKIFSNWYLNVLVNGLDKSDYYQSSL